jgi:LDH2 family malate/lactate/ureidoglycolate dehydrogenase
MLQDEGVRLPGDQRPARRMAAERDGLDMPEALLQKLRQLAG